MKLSEYKLIKMGRNCESAEIYVEIGQVLHVLLYDKTGCIKREGIMNKTVDETVAHYRSLGYKLNRKISK